MQFIKCEIEVRYYNVTSCVINELPRSRAARYQSHTRGGGYPGD